MLKIADNRPILIQLEDPDYGQLTAKQCAELIDAQLLTPVNLGANRFMVAPRRDFTPEMISALQNVGGLTSVSVRLIWSEVPDEAPLTPEKFPYGVPASAIYMIHFNQQ